MARAYAERSLYRWTFLILSGAIPGRAEKVSKKAGGLKHLPLFM